jgi:hypothetical protein
VKTELLFESYTAYQSRFARGINAHLVPLKAYSTELRFT